MVKIGYLLFAVLALSIEKGSSINCYNCISSSVSPTAGCATGALTSATSITCPTGLNYCMTTTLRTDVLGIVTVTDTRACSATAVATGCITAIGTTTCTSTCNTDNCNSGTLSNAAGTVGGNTITFTIMLLTQALFLFLLK